MPTNLKSTFGDYLVSDQAIKIKFSSIIVVGGKTDRKHLLRPEWDEELYKPNSGKLAIPSLLKQSVKHFIKNHYARHKRRTRKMPR